MNIMAVLDQIFYVVAPIALIILTGALIAFTLTEVGIFFYDRKEKKKEDADQ